MNQRENFGQIVATAFFGSVIGASLFVLVMAVLVQFHLGLILWALPVGWVAAALTAWPAGTLFGWVISRTGPSTGPRAAAAGGVTGLALILAVVLLGSDFPHDAGPEEWLYLWGFTLLGAVSGWLAYRLMLRPKRAAE